jgi:hypothetical protein
MGTSYLESLTFSHAPSAATRATRLTPSGHLAAGFLSMGKHSKKKSKENSWKKRAEPLEEALRVAREAVDQDRRTGGSLAGVASESLFAIEPRPGSGSGGAAAPRSRRERREAQPALWVDKVVGGNKHIEPVYPPRQHSAAAIAAAAAPKKKPPLAPHISKRKRGLAPKPVPLLPFGGPAGQLTRAAQGTLSDIWAADAEAVRRPPYAVG